MSRQSDAAEAYARYGWLVVPLHAPARTPSGQVQPGVCTCMRGAECGDPGKHPRLRAWQNEATSDIGRVQAWWRRWPYANVGVALGQASGIIDLECDSPEAEANLVELFGGEPPATICFRSRRGIHRLFRWREGFDPNLSNFHSMEIEVRTGNGGRGAQSVFPGSFHGTTGAPIDWILSPEEGDPADIPDDVVQRLMAAPARASRARTATRPAAGGSTAPEGRGHISRVPDLPADPLAEISENELREAGLSLEAFFPASLTVEAAAPALWRDISNAVSLNQGGRDDNLFRYASSLCRLFVQAKGVDVFDDEDRVAQLRDLVRGINLLKCSPPLDDSDAIVKADQAIGYARTDAESRLNDQLTGNYQAIGLVKDDGQWWPGAWQLDITDAEDAEFVLHVPWSRRPLVFTADDFRNPASIEAAAARQQIVLSPRPGLWEATWRGTKGSKERKPIPGLYGKLISQSRRVRSAPGQDIRRVMAEALLNMFVGAVDLEDRTLPQSQGRVYRRSSGSLVFRFDFVLVELMQIEGITRNRLARLLQELNVDTWRPGRGGSGGVWREIHPADLQRLEHIAGHTELRVVDEPEADRAG